MYVHIDVPSPWTTTGSPRSIRSITAQPPGSGAIASSYVWAGRTIVTGKLRSANAARNTLSASTLLRMYAWSGLCANVDSLTGPFGSGRWYTDADEMCT